jgi:hypothetical protein
MGLITPASNRVALHAAASVDHDNAGTPAYFWQSGAFSSTITDNGAGDLTHNLGADYAIDATQAAAFFSRNGANTAGSFATVGVVFATDTTVRVTINEDDGTPALADIDYFMQIWKFHP